MAIQASELRGKIDFGIITIIQEEHEAVLKRFTKKDVVKGRQEYILSYVYLGNNEKYSIVIIRCPEPGTGRAQKVTTNLIEDLDPQWLVVCGIAGAIPSNDYSLGDVILATRLQDLRIRAVDELDGNQPSGFSTPMHERILSFVANLRAREDEIKGWNYKRSIGLERPSIKLAKIPQDRFYGDDAWKTKVISCLKTGFESSKNKYSKFTDKPVASSDNLVKDSRLAKEWKATARYITAIEMELAGVCDAARTGDKEYPILAIRGISDIVGFKRDPGWTKYACHSAAAFAYAVIKKLRPIEPCIKTENP